jgi:hypothetical protein
VVQKLHSGFFVSHAWLYSQNGGKYVVYNIIMLVHLKRDSQDKVWNLFCRERVCRVCLEFEICLERRRVWRYFYNCRWFHCKRSLFQQLEMSYYCISKPYYNLKILVLVLVLVLRTDLTIIFVKVRLFLHVIISQLVCSGSHRPAKLPTLVTSFSAVLRATGLKSRNLMWVNYEG